MLPLGMKLYLGCFIIRQIALIGFLLSHSYAFMWIYVLFIIPAVYLVIAMFNTKFDKFNLFKDKVD